MLKIYILLLALVICSEIVLFTRCSDEEFAEFDDLTLDDLEDSIGRQSEKQEQKTASKSNKIEPEAKLYAKSKEKSSFDVDGNDEIKNKNANDGDDVQQKKPDLKLVNAPLPQIYKWESYYIEISFLFASVLYFLNFFVGSSKNNKFARDWYDRSKELLKQQFSLVGGSPQINDGSPKKDEDGEFTFTKRQKGLIKSSESLYTVWNSGRVGVDGLLVEINLLKRQDLFSMALNLLKPTKDTLIMRFLLNSDGYENFVFCLAHKTHAPKLTRQMVDINTFCPKRKPLTQYGVNSDRLFIMSELSDVATFILDQKTISFLMEYEKSINYIHITDQYPTIKSEEVQTAQKLANSKRMATFSFNLPLNAKDREEFLLFALSLLDRLRRFKLARDSKQKSEKNRQKITDIIQKTQFSQRQEAAQAKKEELRRLEKERIYSEDDPEKQRRWEKKEAKRELKKNKMRVKQLKVKSM